MEVAAGEAWVEGCEAWLAEYGGGAEEEAEALTGHKRRRMEAVEAPPAKRWKGGDLEGAFAQVHQQQTAEEAFARIRAATAGSEGTPVDEYDVGWMD